MAKLKEKYVGILGTDIILLYAYYVYHCRTLF